MPDNSWDFIDPASRDCGSRVRRDADDFFALVSDPRRWRAGTACEGWEVRDVVGHMIDATEGYFPGWEAAHTGAVTPEPVGLKVMAARCDANAKALRVLSQDEAIARLRLDFDQQMAAFEKLDDESWSSLIVTHPYMGPLPAKFFAIFQLVDYAVHAWDIRQGTDAPHELDGDSADLLVPLMFVLWQATTGAIGHRAVLGRRSGDRRQRMRHTHRRLIGGSAVRRGRSVVCPPSSISIPRASCSLPTDA